MPYGRINADEPIYGLWQLIHFSVNRVDQVRALRILCDLERYAQRHLLSQQTQ